MSFITLYNTTGDELAIDSVRNTLWSLQFTPRVRQFQIISPEWLSSEKYDIVAKVPPATEKHSLNLMFQQLLKERFDLKFHHEKREFAVYVLLAGKQGPKFQRSESAPTPETPFPDAPIPFPTMSHGLLTLTARHKSMQQLADALAMHLDRPVMDMTELIGNFDFSLTWVAEGRGDGVTPADTTPGDSPLEAVQRQLGLRMDSRKLPLDTLQIDSARKDPLGN